MTACLLLALLVTYPALGATYYVAPDGSDANPGTRKAPFATISQAAQVLQPGDTCFVRAGIYRETVRPAQSGRRGAPIRFVAYRDEPVMVTGADLISGWTPYQGSIYQAPADFDFNQLFVDWEMMTQARWPNTGLDLLHPARAVADGGAENKSLIDAELDQPDGFWNGAKIHITPGAHWVSWTRTIKEYSRERHELAWDQPWSTDWAYITKEGSYYYLFGILAALDAPCEWHLEAESKTVYLWTPDGDDPSEHLVEAKRRGLAFDLSERSYVQISGFGIFAATITMAGADHCLVENCHLLYPSHFTQCDGWGTGMDDTGVIISGQHNQLRRSSVGFSAGNGVSLLGESNRVVNCLIHDCNYMATDCGLIRAMGRDHLISHCTLYNAGRSGIVNRYLKRSRIEYNNIYNVGLLTADLGATYCYDTDGEGTLIAYNWVHDNHANTGVGIYIDNNSPNHLIHHNVTWNNADSGIRLNTPTANCLVYNNTCYNNGNSIGYWGPDNNSEWQGGEIFNNIFSDEVSLGTNATSGNNFSGDDPRFVYPDDNDFRLQPDSPCIDAGKIIPGITDDFRGNAPDIGAYEYEGDDWVPGIDWGEPARPSQGFRVEAMPEEGPAEAAPEPIPKYIYIPAPIAKAR